MLRELRATGLGVIEDLTLEFEPGLNVITGETGAGKSMIVGALGLLFGARAESGALRKGVDEAEAEALLTPTESAAERLDAMGLPVEDELVIARRLRVGGSRAYINGRLATAGQLRDLAPALADIVGQHSAQSLLRSATHRDALDRFGGPEHLVAATMVRELFDRRSGLEAELHAVGGDPAALARESEMLERQMDEIDAVALRDGELDELTSEIARLANAEFLREESGAGYEAASAARDMLADAAARVGRLDDPMLSNAAAALDDLVTQADDAVGELRSFVEICTADPARLEELQQRRSDVGDLLRKYGPNPEDVATFRSDAQRRLEQIKVADTRSAELREQLTAIDTEWQDALSALSARRREAAPELAHRIQDRLVGLALPGARFEIDVSRLDVPTRRGGDAVEFLFAGGRGQPLRPLGSVASGGELSRIMLAIATEVANLDAAPTIVFDEIDSGIGGEGAAAVGRALAALGVRRQLLCVTHLAQVACFADHHIVLRKDDAGVACATHLEVDSPADGAGDGDRSELEGRVVELSRMLSGRPDSSSARDHAAELLESAREYRSTLDHVSTR